MAAEQADTIVGAQVELKGSLKNTGPIHIFGKVTGDIHSDSVVIVGETAVIHGPIVAKAVGVAGKVVGSITAEDQIELEAKSFIKGDLSTRRLSIKPGAVFIGQSHMEVPGEKGATDDEELETPSERRKPRLEIE